MSTPATASTTAAWLGPIRQSAFVVNDIEVAALEWATMHGVGPWRISNVEIPNTNYRGEKTMLRARMSLAQSGGQQIELIEPDMTLPSVYREFLEAGGSGVHHVCYWANIKQSREHFERSGSEVVQEGITAAGNEFLYITGNCAIPYLEFVDPNEAMMARFTQVAEASASWDGSNPVRFA